MEANITKLMLSYFRHIIRRQGSLERTIMLVKNRRHRKREGPNMKWTGSTEEFMGTSLYELSRAAEDRTLWTPFTRGSPEVITDSTAIAYQKIVNVIIILIL